MFDPGAKPFEGLFARLQYAFQPEIFRLAEDAAENRAGLDLC